MTEDIEQLKALLDNQEWRLNNLYWIEDKEGNLVRFRMKYEQADFYHNLWTRNEVLKARQLGFSTLIDLILFDLCMFNMRFNAGIIDKTLNDAKLKLGKIRTAYEHLDYVPPNPTPRDLALAEIGRSIKEKNKVTKQQETSMAWSNGSRVTVATSMRGGTLQALHVSELANVAAHAPKRAREIKTGALNTVSKNCFVFKESTHEGGRSGINYEMVATAMANVGKKLSPLDYRFFFYSWHTNPEYRLDAAFWDDLKNSRDDMQQMYCRKLTEYFAHLAQLGIRLDDEQKAWYASQEKALGFSVRQEYPTTPEEAFETLAEQAVYGDELSVLRLREHLCADFETDSLRATFISYDLGHSDLTSMWLFQVGRDGRIWVCDHYANRGFGIDHYIAVARTWEAKYGVRVVKHFLPHDARNQGLQGNSVEYIMIEAGFTVSVVPRTPKLSDGIDSTKRLLPHCVFHERCSQRLQTKDGKEVPSGIRALSNYQWAPEGANGILKQEPLHDIYSHSADSFRYFCEAWDAHLVSKHGSWTDGGDPYHQQRATQCAVGAAWLHE